MRKIFSFLLIAIMAMGVTACSSKPAATAAPVATTEVAEAAPATEAPTAELPLVGVCIYKYDDNFMGFVRQNIEKAAEGKAELVMNDSQNDQAKQNDQVDAMIAKGVNALAINLVDPGAATAIAEKAKAADIPVIFFNKEYPEGTDKVGYDKAWYVGTNSAESGVIQGQLMAEKWKANPTWDKNKDGKMQYVMLMGEPGHPDAEARTKYSIETVVAAGIGVEELAKQTGMWDAAKGKNLWKHGLQLMAKKLKW